MSRTYTWNGKTLPISCPDVSDEDVAARVRMLHRNDLDHELVCTLARDRIMAMSKELTALQSRVAELEREAQEDAALTDSRIKYYRELLRSVLDSVCHDDPRLRYVNVQLGRGEIAEIRKTLDGVVNDEQSNYQTSAQISTANDTSESSIR